MIKKKATKKIAFRKIKLSKDNKAKLDVINSIIREYQAQGYVLTLRQLYYQLVSRDIIPNALAEYAKVSKLLKEGRMAGIVDWDAIEDRLRKPYTPGSWESPKQILESAIYGFQLPRMKGQYQYLEVWVEKDALSGVLKRVTSKYHVPILVNRGYSSASAMYDSYVRFKEAIENGQTVTILYLGDYDPSGIDMIRDIEARTLEFFYGSEDMKELFNESEYKIDYEDNVDYSDWDRAKDEDEDEYRYRKGFEAWAKFQFTVKPIALTLDQINLYSPPPNPAKKTDPRSAKFIKELGSTSWEVDALKPEVLHSLLEHNIQDHIDIPMYEDIVAQEEAHKQVLRDFADTLD